MPSSAAAPRKPWYPLTLVLLFVAPGRYFKNKFQGVPGWVMFLFVWLVGAAGCKDEVFEALMRWSRELELSGYGPQLKQVLTQWPAFWITLAAFGALHGAINWIFGAWWFSLRVWLSGDGARDKWLARSIYMQTELIWAVPSLAVLLYETRTYSGYGAAPHAVEFWLPCLFVAWSCHVAYAAVTLNFKVSPGRAYFLFFLLPMGFYCVLLGMILAFAMIATQIDLAALFHPDRPSIERTAPLSEPPDEPATAPAPAAAPASAATPAPSVGPRPAPTPARPAPSGRSSPPALSSSPAPSSAPAANLPVPEFQGVLMASGRPQALFRIPGRNAPWRGTGGQPIPGTAFTLKQVTFDPASVVVIGPGGPATLQPGETPTR